MISKFNENIEYKKEDNTLTLHGTGEYDDYDTIIYLGEERIVENTFQTELYNAGELQYDCNCKIYLDEEELLLRGMYIWEVLYPLR